MSVRYSLSQGQLDALTGAYVPVSPLDTACQALSSASEDLAVLAHASVARDEVSADFIKNAMLRLSARMLATAQVVENMDSSEGEAAPSKPKVSTRKVRS